MTALLQTRNLAKHFGGVRALDGVDFTLQQGELRCLIGPNGAGKSTFFKLLTGQLKPSAGQVLYRGQDISGWQSHDIARLGVGIKTQVPSLFDGLSVRENVWIAARGRSTELLAQLDLESVADKPAGQLAHGQRQWVELAVLLAAEPELLLLDEPAAGMTQDEVQRTAALIRDINRTRSLIVIEHDMQFVRLIASTVTVLDRGRVLAEGPVEEVLRDPKVRDVYLGKRGVA